MFSHIYYVSVFLQLWFEVNCSFLHRVSESWSCISCSNIFYTDTFPMWCLQNWKHYFCFLWGRDADLTSHYAWNFTFPPIWGTDIDNLQVLFLILKSVFISIHTKDFVWTVVLQSYFVNSSPRFLTCSSLSFIPLIYWIYLWTKFLPENMFYLYYIMLYIIW